MQLSQRALGLSSSVIRDLLRAAGRPGMLNLAGGLPASEHFPLAELGRTAQQVLADPAALQYGPTEGDERLRAWVARDQGVPVEQVLITHGSQQGLDLVARALIDPGDPVAVEEPGYLGALQALAACQAHILAVPVDEHGLVVEELARRCADSASDGGPVLVHTVSQLHNPTGVSLSPARARALEAVADAEELVLVEDDPYGHLRWAGVSAAGLVSRWGVRLGTFSKSLAPGLRVGWLIAPPELMVHLVRLKQATDLHTSSLGQALVAELVSRPGWYEEHLAALVPAYKARAEALVEALERRLGPRLAGLELPDGGMFCWFSLPGIDTSALVPVALEQGVALVPGAAFGDPRRLGHHLRASFATLSVEEMDEAAARLARAADALDAQL